MYENVYGKTPPPRFGENAVTLPLDVDRPCSKRSTIFNSYLRIWAILNILKDYMIFWYLI